MKNLKMIFTVLTGLSLLAGCGMADSGNGADDNNLQTRNVGYNNGNDGNYMNNGDNGMLDGNGDNNGQQTMEEAEKAASKVNELKEVRDANVIVTENNAFVAVVMEDNAKGEVTKDIEQKVAKAVKDTDKDINNVYVSSNPDFVKRMKDYGNDLQNGKPVKGLFEEFSEMTRRVFPNAR
ncbi:YhcN/YlaJ family sporulation lipoprotein [Bacillus salacetis]|uniref:YhcN/YlaJ family sporulation lipoprotein n=1 Tax=Bacillus salacetis TaxID=2315464 RepID=A0A3A1QVB1_9BACI|nr:YhcN/YlaJ family sporulation lipoprotein [Bacillus salacetis]RIW29047.1 YhcN/YlaJ family sporulation lipoprotein [Bacillus salacetis]